MEADVRSVRQMLAARRLPNLTIVESPKNNGLANSIIAGVRRLCDTYGRVIVIEDDLIASPALLTWFNDALETYDGVPDVWQISGHQFPVPAFAPRQDSMFLGFSTSWGWATWKSAWSHFDSDASGYEALRRDPALRSSFNLNDAYPYAEMLERQMAGAVDSWAIRWWWSMFRAGALGLFPPRSLVVNIGCDETATHASSRLARFLQPVRKTNIATQPPSFPTKILLDKEAQGSLEGFLRTQNRKMQWARAIMARLK
ncbi:MAG TPA: hypothetical protein VNW15_04895 [Rhizomicrobium sp.]|nr:hypothetical protein [Rhizomicrobium sp.]